MNELTGQSHGPGFCFRYRTEFVNECKRIADAVPDELGRRLAQFGPLMPPRAEPRSETGTAREPAGARLQ